VITPVSRPVDHQIHILRRAENFNRDVRVGGLPHAENLISETLPDELEPAEIKNDGYRSTGSLATCGFRRRFSYDPERSKRPRFITLFHTATKSWRNFSWESSHP
jgi:hypothetical protein